MITLPKMNGVYALMGAALLAAGCICMQPYFTEFTQGVGLGLIIAAATAFLMSLSLGILIASSE